MREYNYRCENRSGTQKAFIRMVVSPFLRIVPRFLPANYISILSHFALYLGLYFSYAGGRRSAVDFAVIPMLILIHLIGDKMDGIRARETNTASPLGELIDHFFEAFNTGAFIFIVFHWFDIAHEWVLMLAIGMALLVSMAKFYEQYKNNLRVIDVFGTFELKLITALAILVSFHPSVFQWLNRDIFSGYTIVEQLMILAAAGGIISFVRTVLRIRHITYGFWLFIFLLAVVMVTSTITFDEGLAAIIVLFYGGLYIGNLLSGQLVDGVERSPGLFTPLFLIIHVVTSYFNPFNTFFILMMYLIVNLTLTLIKGFRALKDGWYWHNPAGD